MNPESVSLAGQTELGVTEDGKAGPETWGAIYNALTGKNALEVDAFAGYVDDRSEAVIAKLRPEVRSYASALVQR